MATVEDLEFRIVHLEQRLEAVLSETRAGVSERNNETSSLAASVSSIGSVLDTVQSRLGNIESTMGSGGGLAGALVQVATDPPTTVPTVDGVPIYTTGQIILGPPKSGGTVRTLWVFDGDSTAPQWWGWDFSNSTGAIS
jgi:hypothetical protein